MNTREARAECSKRWCAAPERRPMALRRKRTPKFVVGYHEVENGAIVQSWILGRADTAWEDAFGHADQMLKSGGELPKQADLVEAPRTGDLASAVVDHVSARSKLTLKVLEHLATRKNPATIKMIADTLFPGEVAAWSVVRRVLDHALAQRLVENVNLMQWRISETGREALRSKDPS